MSVARFVQDGNDTLRRESVEEADVSGCMHLSLQVLCCRFTTYRHRFARVAPAPRAKLIESWTREYRGRASPYSNQSPSRAPRAATGGA